MQIILLERIARLGQMGDVVTVKDGFARNFLLPQGKALRANSRNLAKFETDRAQLEARNLELKNEAEAVAGKLDGESFIAIRQAGDSGQLYGSVSTKDIAQAVTEGGFSVTRNQVQLDRPIKSLGLYDLKIFLHPEVASTITVNVARTEDEAERQARGEDVRSVDDEIEELLGAEEDSDEDAESVFEDGAEPSDADAAGDTGDDTAEAAKAEETDTTGS